MAKIGIGNLGDIPIPVMIEAVRQAEERGYDSVWMTEDYFYRDGFTPQMAFAMATKRMKVATGVVNPYTRNVVVNAITIATIDEVSNGRAILGIGAGGPRTALERMGVSYRKQLSAVRESVEIIRRLLRGEEVTYQGEFFNIQKIKLDFAPVRERIPIYIGSMFPKSLQQAGEIGDGVLLSSTTSPEYVKFAIENVKIGAERAGRDIKEIEIASFIQTSVAEEYEEAKAAIKTALAYLAREEEFLPVWKQSAEWLIDETLPLRKASTMDKAAELVTDRIIDAVTVTGPPSKCRRRMEDYISAGVQVPIVLPALGSLGKTIDTFAP